MGTGAAGAGWCVLTGEREAHPIPLQPGSGLSWFHPLDLLYFKPRLGEAGAGEGACVGA